MFLAAGILLGVSLVLWLIHVSGCYNVESNRFLVVCHNVSWYVGLVLLLIAVYAVGGLLWTLAILGDCMGLRIGQGLISRYLRASSAKVAE